MRERSVIPQRSTARTKSRREFSRAAGANISRRNIIRDAFRHPCLWITLALIANVLEGAVRKWVPGFGDGVARLIAYFSKDLIFALGAAMIWGLLSNNRKAIDTFQNWFFVGLGMITVGALISSLHDVNLVGSILTLRALVILPLIALIFAKRLNNFPLLAVASVVVILTLINLPLSLLQSRLPADHVLNRYASGEMDIVEVAYGVRATGTFAYITGLGVMSAAGIWAGLVVLSLGRGWKFQSLGVAGLLGGLGCAFASVSRGSVVVALAMISLWALSSTQTITRIWKAVWCGAVAGLLALLFMPSLAESFLHMGEGAFDRFTSAGDSNTNRAFGQFEEMLFAISRHPMGLGLGTEQVGGNVAASGVAGFTSYESQFPRVVAELGLVGLFGFFLLVIGTVLALQQAKEDVPGGGFPLAMTATQLLFLSQSYTSLMVNHTASAFAWLCVCAALASGVSQKPKREISRERVDNF